MFSRKVCRIKAKHFDKFQSQTKESVIFTKIGEKSKSNTRAKSCIPCSSLIEQTKEYQLYVYLSIYIFYQFSKMKQLELRLLFTAH